MTYLAKSELESLTSIMHEIAIGPLGTNVHSQKATYIPANEHRPTVYFRVSLSNREFKSCVFVPGRSYVFINETEKKQNKIHNRLAKNKRNHENDRMQNKNKT